MQKLIAVGGGRGGVGKSVVAQNLAIYFAQLGKAVVLVDADSTGANVHAHFGLSASRREPLLSRDSEGLEKSLVATGVPGVHLLPFPHDADKTPAFFRVGRKARWLAKLRSLSADYVVIDAGPGHASFVADIMNAADIGIVVTVPEPPAVETTYRFLRASFRRRLERILVTDRFRSSLLERTLRELGFVPSPLELVRALHKKDKYLADAAWTEAQRMCMYLVVNQTRLRNDLDLGQTMSTLCARHYGIALEELGHVEYDDTVWLTVRRNRPLLVDSPTSKAARNLERIARRVVALLTAPEPQPRGVIAPQGASATLYEAIGVERSATEEEIRRACKRQREVYMSGSIAISSLFDATQLKVEQARLDEAHDTLLDAVRRRAYDLSTFRDNDKPASVRLPDPVPHAEQLMLKAELAREIGPDTEFSGPLLRKVRDSLGLDLAAISQKTKIARAHFEAIESEAYGTLPAVVYLRGFLTEFAKVLRLDPSQVQKSYLRRMREADRHAGGPKE